MNIHEGRVEMNIYIGINFISTISLFLIFFGVLTARGEERHSSSQIEVSSNEIAAKIIENEKRLHGINISNNKAKEALAFLLKKREIKLSNFAELSKQGNIIIAGLKLVVNKQENASLVYKQLEMASKGISQETWSYYLKNYSLPEKIEVLEGLIPDSMEKIIASGAVQFRKQLSDWLLLESIISSFNTMFPNDVDLKPTEKEKKWWNTAIEKYKLSHNQKQSVLSNITVYGALSDQDSELMREFFNLKPVHKDKK